MSLGRPRVSLVVNPASNKGAAVAVGARVASHLSRAAEVRVFSGRSQAESVSILAHAGEDADAVVVCGGDGIVHLAVNALAQGEVPLGIIPAGTGNDTATALGIDPDPLRAADALLAALHAKSVRRIDLGHCDAVPVSPNADGRWWVTMLYAGFDSGVNERANRMRWPSGKRRYDLAIAAEMLRLRSRALTLQLDDQTIRTPMTLVAIGNGPQYGGGKLMTPGARMDDGIFDVTVVGAVSRLTLARLAPTLPRAGHLRHPAVTTYRSATVTIEAPQTVAWADGERVGDLPVRTVCVAGALAVLVPIGPSAPGLSRSEDPAG
ncbi:diacylglycerol kinase [Jatrophihabitans telluris]|uniref:Diacylglycerol kinase n=1 Tax=Jatrophihabitans telluris TaxID=2038343 RepID=A0ABY4QU52_9ACTN|nr:diacylglycerol kinase family protein [Jatrophihabitans telluris]UQX86662.1 diacylglycerol kinase [Jatrophihabitans telluris]